MLSMIVCDVNPVYHIYRQNNKAKTLTLINLYLSYASANQIILGVLLTNTKNVIYDRLGRDSGLIKLTRKTIKYRKK